MDKADTRERTSKESTSIIGADIVVTGNIEASVDLHVEGRVIGDIRCVTLILGEASSVNGRIQAERVRVSGKVEGAIETRDLAIEATAAVRGEITYERLKVANGGSIEGQITRRVSEDGGQAAPLKLVEQPEGAESEAAAAAAQKVHYFE